MNATAVVAIAGLVATTTLGLVSPFLQGWISAKNARRAKGYDLAVATYTDAMVHLQSIEVGINHLIDPSDRNPGNLGNDHKHVDLITARLRLVAPTDVIAAWTALVEADFLLDFYIRESVDHRRVEAEGLPEDLDLIVDVRRKGRAASEAIRHAAGVAN